MREEQLKTDKIKNEKQLKDNNAISFELYEKQYKEDFLCLAKLART